MSTPLYDMVAEGQAATRRNIKKRMSEELILQRENIQNDLDCILDGLDDEIFTNVCQVIVDRFNIILEKLDE